MPAVLCLEVRLAEVGESSWHITHDQQSIFEFRFLFLEFRFLFFHMRRFVGIQPSPFRMVPQIQGNTPIHENHVKRR